MREDVLEPLALELRALGFDPRLRVPRAIEDIEDELAHRALARPLVEQAADAGRRDVDAHVRGGGERRFDQRGVLEVGGLVDEEQAASTAAADVVAGLTDDRGFVGGVQQPHVVRVRVLFEAAGFR